MLMVVQSADIPIHQKSHTLPLSRAKREKFPFYIPLTGAHKSASKTTTFERRAKRALNKYPLSLERSKRSSLSTYPLPVH